MLREVLTCHVYSVNSSQSTLLHHESRYTVLSSDTALHVYVSSSTQSNWKTGNWLERFRLLCFICLCTFIVFYRATACNATHRIVVAMLSVCLSVCPSVRCVYCDKTKLCIAHILILHETAITLVLWHQQRLVGDAPSLWNIRQKWPTPFVKRRLRDRLMFYTGPAWRITTPTTAQWTFRT